MNYKETIEYIHSLGNFTLPPSLERIKTVCEILGNIQNSFPAVHIAGTNGKGSVSSMLSKVFQSAGYKTGLFISPFIIDFRERIQINGNFIPQKTLCELSQKVINTNIKLNEFEFITAVAFLYFAEEKCDIVVCETGLGGRLDATNVLENKIASVLCKIGLDHTSVLGGTIEEITKEKCGIIKKSKVVSNPNQPKEAFSVIKKYADNLIIPTLSQFENLQDNKFIYKGKEYELSLIGDFQKENALVVLETIENLEINIPYETVYKALKNTFFPARMEKLCENPLIIIDGAHNPDGASVLAEEIKKYNGNVTAVVGMMKDKAIEEVLKTVLPYCKNSVITEVENMPRSITAKELFDISKKYCKGYIETDYKKAIEKAVAISNGGAVFIFGSLYLAADIRKNLIKNKYF